MPAPEASAEDIAARLSACGLTPRVKQHTRHTSIEAEVPEAFTGEAWREVLEAVAEADRFGLFADSVNGRTLWAAVRREARDVRSPGPDRQR
ncbi:hypothetical protein ACIPW9_26140 [Streptomyces sp. NPDC090052]|uniref:hypothetical protein n=1 Tax=Streptomyces sp. NPDC090052 TaxID=3365931 RepID=UPI003803207D